MKRFKSRKKKNKKRIIKFILLITICYISCSYSLQFLLNKKIKNKVSNQVLVNYLLKSGSNDLLKLSKTKSLFNINGGTLLRSSTNNLIDDSMVVFEDSYDDSTIVTSYFEDPNKYEVKRPLVYLYNTHQLEEYSNSNVNMYNASPNVLMASYILKEKLNGLNIPTIVEETDITEILRTNNWNYGYSYKASKLLIEDALSKNASLTYLIDIHRDSLGHDRTTLTVDDKSYAKLMFVVGLEHDNYQSNLAIAEKLNDIITSKQPGISKGVLKKGGAGVNGIYNQDLSSKAMLIEVGGPENTIDEVTNTLNIIADSLYDLIRGDV